MINAVIDLSDNQANEIDFKQVAAQGVLGVIHKASQGRSHHDPNYAARKPQALQAGLLWGAYHYGDNADGTAQAQNFLSFVNPGPTDLLVLDLEDNSAHSDGCMTVAQAEDFVRYVHQQTGRYPGLYSSDTYLRQIGADRSAVLAQCWLWVARYADLAAPTHPAAWPTWTLWQYTDGVHGNEPHAVAGVGPCDRSQFNGAAEGLHRLWNVPLPA